MTSLTESRGGNANANETVNSSMGLSGRFVGGGGGDGTRGQRREVGENDANMYVFLLLFLTLLVCCLGPEVLVMVCGELWGWGRRVLGA